MITEEKVNAGIKELGGYPVSGYRNLKKVDERIEWHVMPMLEADQLPRPY